MIDLMPNIDDLFSEIKSDFDSFWSIKNRNATAEFITPYTMLGGDAVSVFVTQRDNGYVVSDGGRLFDVGVEQNVELDSHKSFHYGDLIEKFGVKVTVQEKTKRRFFYKMTSDIKMLSSIIYDMVHFQEALANAVYLDTMFAAEEPKESVFFRKRVNDMLRSKLRGMSSAGDKRYEYFRDDKARFCRFATGIKEVGTQKIWLGMTICRTNINNYRHSVYQAEFGFAHVKKFMPGVDLRMASIVDELPVALSKNNEAGLLQLVMDEWTEKNIQSYAFGEVSGLTTFENLFAA